MEHVVVPDLPLAWKKLVSCVEQVVHHATVRSLPAAVNDLHFQLEQVNVHVIITIVGLEPKQARACWDVYTTATRLLTCSVVALAAEMEQADDVLVRYRRIVLGL